MNYKRRLIVCCDGTWQDLEQPYPTNVVKLAQGVRSIGEDGVSQIIFYDGGVGTKQINSEGSWLDRINRIGGGALGAGIDNKILNAYRFLSLNYQPGDEIFLFGFSRGAYTVRCLAGLIYNCGLPAPQYVRKIPAAYEMYRDKDDRQKAPNGQEAKEFRRRYGDRPPIKALCCWDTVAALGLPDLLPNIGLDEAFNKRYSFHDSRLNPTIEHAFHAVSIDEPRKVFNVTLMTAHASNPHQLTQVWFPGCHGSVGGGTAEERGLSDAALEWMINNLEPLGLKIDQSLIEDGIKTEPTTPFKKPDKGILAAPGLIQRVVDAAFEDLHISVKRRWKRLSDYRPTNLRQYAAAFEAWSDS